MIQFGARGIAAALLVLALAPASRATSFISLVNANNIDLLQLATSGSGEISNAISSTANEAIVQGTGTITSSGGTTLSGGEFYFSSLTQVPNCSQTTKGCTVDASDLSVSGGNPNGVLDGHAVTDYNTATGLTTTVNEGNINNPGTAPTIAATGQLTVAAISGLTLTSAGKNLTLNGTAADVFVLKISGSMNLGNGDSIVLTGGILPQDVLLVFTGSTAQSITLSGGTVNGTLLVDNPHYTLTLDGTINGMVVADNTVTVGANSTGLTINGGVNTFNPAPEPGTWTMGLAGFAGIGLWRFRRARRTHANGNS